MLMGLPRTYFCFPSLMSITFKKQKGNFYLAPKFVLLDPKEQNQKSGKSHIISTIHLTNLQIPFSSFDWNIVWNSVKSQMGIYVCHANAIAIINYICGIVKIPCLSEEIHFP